MKPVIDQIKEKQGQETYPVKIKVRLFGLLSRHVSGYDHAKGIVVEVQEEITYGDLITLLNLPESEIGFFSAGGIMKRSEEHIADGDEIKIFMPLAGG